MKLLVAHKTQSIAVAIIFLSYIFMMAFVLDFLWKHLREKIRAKVLKENCYCCTNRGYFTYIGAFSWAGNSILFLIHITSPFTLMLLRDPTKSRDITTRKLNLSPQVVQTIKSPQEKVLCGRYLVTESPFCPTLACDSWCSYAWSLLFPS